MRESIKDYLSIAISTITLSVILFGWASNMLDDRINESVTKAMTPFVAQLNANTQAIHQLESSLDDTTF